MRKKKRFPACWRLSLWICSKCLFCWTTIIILSLTFEGLPRNDYHTTKVNYITDDWMIDRQIGYTTSLGHFDAEVRSKLHISGNLLARMTTSINHSRMCSSSGMRNSRLARFKIKLLWGSDMGCALAGNVASLACGKALCSVSL